MNETALTNLPATNGSGSIAAFSGQANFDAAQRMAKAMSHSSLVPEAYRGNIPNVLIAMELASRIGVSVFAAMQNLDIIHGRPSWRSQFLIATVNGSGRFSPIRFQFQGAEGKDSWGCRAVANDRENGEECRGPLITIALAKAEGWYQKKGSKWQTLPELMLSYRAAAFWTRLFAPELSLGMQTAEEASDITATGVVSELPRAIVSGNVKALEGVLSSVPEDPAEKPPTDEPTPDVELPSDERQSGDD